MSQQKGPSATFTAKEMKALWRPRFQEDPERYYPRVVFEDFGFKRHICPKCGTLYWRRSELRTTCGDSECIGEYSFFDAPERKTDRWSMRRVWDSFTHSFTRTDPAHTIVSRYPVVARWRDDCEFTAAGIQCYQPFCVTGEIEPPANPLIQPQLCLRFNDLDSIGLSGRHYSGFTMLGIQVFNTSAKYVYFKEEIIRFNLEWLQTMDIDLDEVTLIADVWAGGGNLGPCVEYFMHGLEVGNMVFMEFKAFADGTIEPLPVQVVDVGIGLERIPWLLNRSVTSYITAFPSALKHMSQLIGITDEMINGDVWRRFGRYSCLLNIDEINDISQVWTLIKERTGLTTEEITNVIEPIRCMYIVLDHLRSLMVAIQDGALPSNVGGGNNLRNVLRRVFHILVNRGWWDAIGGVDGLCTIIDCHRQDLEDVHGAGSFPPFKPLRAVLELEYTRWTTTDKDSRDKVEKLLKKGKGKLSIEDWVTIVTTFGLNADQVSELTGIPVPDNLYSRVAEQQEKNAIKAAAAQLYDTVSLPPTDCVYYTKPHGEKLRKLADAKVISVFDNVEDKSKGRNLVILDKTVFYPTSGGQQHDTGVLKFILGNGKVAIYNVIDVRKVGHCVMHELDAPVNDLIVQGTGVSMAIDAARRDQLMCHHTAAHVIHATANKVLGPHVWQAGAKKTTEVATLDITHYRSLTFEEERAIEREANRMIRDNIPIRKYQLPKNEAEKKYGFSLYQGGVVPGSTVRCVDIANHDTEACCGTHLDNTGKIGMIRIIKSTRISDGVVRLTFVAGERALDFTDTQSEILHTQMNRWGVDQAGIVKTGDKFFTAMKRLEGTTTQLRGELLNSNLNYAATRISKPFTVFEVSDESPTLLLSSAGEPCLRLLADDNGVLQTMVVFVGETFVVAVGPGSTHNAIVEQEASKICSSCKIKKTPLKKGGRKAKGGDQADSENTQLIIVGLTRPDTTALLTVLRSME